MGKITEFSFDENTRRYYLDVMGIQCWELLNKEVAGAASNAALTDEVDAGSSIAYENTIQQCVRCDFSATRKQAISGRGDPSARLMFILLAPSAADDNAAIICSGLANGLLSKMLTAINVSIEDVFITSLLKCNVPDSRVVSAEDISNCHVHLKQQIQQVQPEFIIVLGDAAARYLLQQDSTLDELRLMNASSSFTIDSVPVFVSYSPQELLQDAALKRKAWADLQQLQKIINA